MSPLSQGRELKKTLSEGQEIKNVTALQSHSASILFHRLNFTFLLRLVAGHYPVCGIYYPYTLMLPFRLAGSGYDYFWVGIPH